MKAVWREYSMSLIFTGVKSDVPFQSNVVEWIEMIDYFNKFWSGYNWWMIISEHSALMIYRDWQEGHMFPAKSIVLKV